MGRERYIDWLPPAGVPTRGLNLQPRCSYVPLPGIKPNNLLLFKMTLQPIEPPGQGNATHFFSQSKSCKMIYHSRGEELRFYLFLGRPGASQYEGSVLTTL